MIHVEDWAEIRRLHRAEGLSARAVARQLGISRGTVLRALASDRPPQYRRAPKGSVVDAVEPAIRELLKQTPISASRGVSRQEARTRRSASGQTEDSSSEPVRSVEISRSSRSRPSRSATASPNPPTASTCTLVIGFPFM